MTFRTVQYPFMTLLLGARSALGAGDATGQDSVGEPHKLTSLHEHTRASPCERSW